MSKKFLVYQHLRKDTGAIFYVGKGTPRRAVSSVGRNKHWKSIVKKSDGFLVEIVFNNWDTKSVLDWVLPSLAVTLVAIFTEILK